MKKIKEIKKIEDTTRGEGEGVSLNTEGILQVDGEDVLVYPEGYNIR